MPKLGTIRAKPPGTRQTQRLADALFTQTQQRVLALLFGQPERSFATSELIALAGSGSGAVQRELQRLVESGLVTITMIGRQKRHQANHAAPIFEELRAIVEKTTGVPEQVRQALAPIAQQIRVAILFGSVAKGSETAHSDVDVLVVSDDLTLEELFDALAHAEQRLGRTVSPTLYTTEEFRRRRQTRHPFLTRILEGAHVVLVGSEDAIAASR